MNTIGYTQHQAGTCILKNSCLSRGNNGYKMHKLLLLTLSICSASLSFAQNQNLDFATSCWKGQASVITNYSLDHHEHNLVSSIFKSTHMICIKQVKDGLCVASYRWVADTADRRLGEDKSGRHVNRDLWYSVPCVYSQGLLHITNPYDSNISCAYKSRDELKCITVRSSREHQAVAIAYLSKVTKTTKLLPLQKAFIHRSHMV